MANRIQKYRTKHRRNSKASTFFVRLIGKFLSLSAIVFICFLGFTLYNLNEMVNKQPLSQCGYQLERRSVPVTLVAAIIAQEDHGFLNHGGVNWREVWQAFVTNLRLGRSAYGASTIDMQVASLCYLKKRNLSKWVEKAYELLLVPIIAKRYSKKDILQAYLTIAPLSLDINGNSESSGFEFAARLYFKKELAKLSYDEEWRLVLTLRNLKTLNPTKTVNADSLPKIISRQWLSAKWRQTQTLKWQKKLLLAFPYIRNKNFPLKS